MSINNGLTLPVILADGTSAEAPEVMSDFNTLLAGLNRALLDTGGSVGMNAQNTPIHNLTDGSSPQDAAAFHQIADAIAAGGYAPLASPAFTGTPTAPTASPGTNTTQLATTAFVAALGALLAPLASPALTGNPTAPTASPGDNDTSIATTAFVQAALSGYLKVAAISLAATGYVKITDGTNKFMIQWAPVSFLANQLLTVNYPQAFGTFSNPVLSAGIADTGADHNWPAVLGGATATQFFAQNAYNGSCAGYWIAIGDYT